MLEGLTPPERTFPCHVRTILERLDESDKKILLDALADMESWSHVALAQALTQRGIQCSDKPIRKHRSGICSCK